MDGVGRVESPGSDIETLQDIQRFQHGRALAPEAGLVNRVAAILRGGGFLQLQVERRHVFVSQQPSVGFAERVDLMGDFAAVEVIAHGVDGGLAVGSFIQRGLLGGGHGAQGAGQIGLAENLARSGNVAVRREGALGIGPPFEESPRARDGTGAHFIDGHAVGEFHRGAGHLAERFGAELAQGEQSRVHHSGNQCGHQAGHRNEAAQAAGVHAQDFEGLRLAIAEKFRGGHLRHGSDPGDGVDFAALVADQDGGLAAQAEVRELRDGGREHGGNTGVDRVAAVKECAHASLGGPFAAGGHGAMGASGGLADRAFGLFSLGPAGKGEWKEEEAKLALHIVHYSQSGEAA